MIKLHAYIPNCFDGIVKISA